jgi:hypothetical protein
MPKKGRKSKRKKTYKMRLTTKIVRRKRRRRNYVLFENSNPLKLKN